MHKNLKGVSGIVGVCVCVSYAGVLVMQIGFKQLLMLMCYAADNVEVALPIQNPEYSFIRYLGCLNVGNKLKLCEITWTIIKKYQWLFLGNASSNVCECLGPTDGPLFSSFEAALQSPQGGMRKDAQLKAAVCY